MAIIWNTKPNPPSEEEQEALIEETMDGAIALLEEELEASDDFFESFEEMN